MAEYIVKNSFIYKNVLQEVGQTVDVDDVDIPRLRLADVLEGLPSEGDITDATPIGLSILTAEDASAARAAIELTTRTFFINGTIANGSATGIPNDAVQSDIGIDTSGTIGRVNGSGQWAILGQIPTWSTIAGKPAVIASGADAAAARAAIGVIVATTAAAGIVKQAAAQASSVATDVVGVVADLNALLTKLKAAGIMA